MKTIKSKTTTNNKPSAIGLFAGCGGLDFGFKMAGFDITYSNDIDQSVKATYEKNIGPINIGDIRSIDKNTLPNTEIILAGIPCQPFSNAGKRESVNDQRGTLFQEVISLLQIKSPKMVVFENVRGFLSAKDNNNKKMPDLLEMELKKVGYNLYYKLLNASSYEVPQNRYRVFLIGIRDDIDKGFNFPDPVNSKNKITVGEVIKKPYPKDEEHEVWELSPQSQKIIQFIPSGGSWKNVPYDDLPVRLKKIKDDMKKYRSPNFYRRFSPNEVMGTITAAATPENSGIVHPLENRRYSVREIARFQSFPDNFKFIGASTSQKYKMIGNAVPVKLAYHMAKAIYEQYFS